MIFCKDLITRNNKFLSANKSIIKVLKAVKGSQIIFIRNKKQGCKSIEAQAMHFLIQKMNSNIDEVIARSK